MTRHDMEAVGHEYLEFLAVAHMNAMSACATAGFLHRLNKQNEVGNQATAEARSLIIIL
jgi:hypothetical protein